MSGPDARTPGLRARLLAGVQLTGAIVRMPCEDVLEMLGVAGLDFVVIDCEHGPADVVDLRRHVTVAQLHDVVVLVRTGEDDPGLVLRALDQGAQGVVIPHVDSAEDAEAAVRASHYPPRGRRGFATYTRAGAFGTVEPRHHQARTSEETVVIAMIESPVGVRAIDEVLAVDGIDGYLVGPADLAAASGPEDPSPEESLVVVHEAGRSARAIRCDIVGDKAAATAALDAGAQLVTYNLAAVLMRTFRDMQVG